MTVHVRYEEVLIQIDDEPALGWTLVLRHPPMVRRDSVRRNAVKLTLNRVRCQARHHPRMKLKPGHGYWESATRLVRARRPDNRRL